MDGLYDKYIITKNNGESVDPNAVYFVLRLDTDKLARRAAQNYALDMMFINPKLYSDLMKLINKLSND